MTRRYGRPLIGQRCNDQTPHGHWKTTTQLSEIRCDHVVEQATVNYDGVMNNATFQAYVQQYLAPRLRPGDVVIMDNPSKQSLK